MFCNATYRKSKDIDIKSTAKHGVKWNHIERLSKYNITIPEDIIPLWIADIDAKVSQEIYEALQAVTEHRIFGYSKETSTLNEVTCKWLQEQHQWTIANKEEIVFSSATITALIFLLYSITQEGDEIIVQQPLYPPLSNCIKNHKRVLKINTLIKHDNTYSLNIPELESLINEKTKMLIVCNPQNPTGRVWKLEELQQIVEICKKHNIYIFSDDVHADIVYKPHCYIPIATIDKEYSHKIITAYSTAKSFNIAGLKISMLHIPDTEIRKEFTKIQRSYIGSSVLSPYAIAAQEAAFSRSLSWLQSLKSELQKNRDMLYNYIQENIPQIHVHKPEGTYLMWLDFSSLQLNEEELFKLIYTKAKIGFSHGIDFGISGSLHMRLNFACCNQLLIEAMQSLQHTLSTL